VIHVKQRQKYESTERRGDCWTACIASIFEVPYETLPDLNSNRQSSLLTEWLALHYPGVVMRQRDHVPFDAEDDHVALRKIAPPGFWIASVESPRFTEECRFHVSGEGTPLPPFWYERDACPHCGGSGERPGFHAVVCRSDLVVHDPSPDVTGYGWEYNGKLCSITWFEVTDPARLIPRALPL
jgi:hypothetical protein